MPFVHFFYVTDINFTSIGCVLAEKRAAKNSRLPRRSSTNSQRRSSILKPPKTRQPFQDLDFNNSSPEISPESTKKRRVSFAEKKHVKEFCDHKEQGTIWDSTYEEPDQNVSKSTEISSENVNAGTLRRNGNENVDISINEAGLNYQRDKEDLINSEKILIMDENNVENTSKRIFFNPGTDLEFTDVIIPCGRVTPNDLMSETIFCQDVELEITEAIGGVEPTVSVKTITNLHPREMRDYNCIDKDRKSTEKTMLFDHSGGEMNFTEVIKGGKIIAPITRNLDIYQESEPTNSGIENQTIIFDDSIMDLTLTKSETDIETNFPQCDKENVRLCDIDNENDCEDPQTSNKTVFFDDFGCDMTEAINTVLHPLAEVNLLKETLAGREIQTTVNSGMKDCVDPQLDINSFTLNEEKNLSNGSDSTLTISDTHSNKTIIFNDYGCEMTEAISTIRNRLAQDEIINETIDAEQIVPRQLDSEMEMDGLSNKTGAEFSPKLISACNNQTQFFNDSMTMEFTKAITRDETVENKVDENSRVEKNNTESFQKCDIDITENVRADICSLNSGSSSEERAELLGTESERNEGQSKNKRKSFEIEEGIDDYINTSNSLMSKNSGHDHQVQSLFHDDSVNTVNDHSDRNCKRLKVAEEESLTVEDDSVTAKPQSLDNLKSITTHISSLNSQDLPEIQIHGESTADVVVVTDTNCSNNQEKSMNDDNVKWNEKESLKITEDDDSEEECSFIEATLANLNSDSESETRELSRFYDKQRQSLSEKSHNIQSRLETNECLDNIDNCCFVMFSEELEKHAKRDDCIWTIRSLDEKRVIIDFISKSLVVIIYLEATVEPTIPKTIKDIKIISLLSDSDSEDISMIHNIILKKLDTDNLKRIYKTTRDVLQMLEFISDKVKLLLNFMYEFDKLQDLHVINRSGNRISFRLNSYKVQLVIKMTIDLEPFEYIGPNDVIVECILGNIREKDIKQLINSVKKDHKFLTNYINDIKEYIAVGVEK